MTTNRAPLTTVVTFSGNGSWVSNKARAGAVEHHGRDPEQQQRDQVVHRVLSQPDQA